MPKEITRTAAKQMLSLFDYAFKKGVLDAADMSDDYLCTEFVRKHKETATFGLLDNPYDMDWREWQFNVGRWCSSGRLLNLYNSFISKITRPGYLMVCIIIAQDFYIRGIEEWMEYKNPVPLQIFKTQSRVHWKPIEGKTMAKMSVNEIVATVQEFTYARSHRAIEKSDPIKASSYEIFGRELWKMTRPIPKLVIDDDF